MTLISHILHPVPHRIITRYPKPRQTIWRGDSPDTFILVNGIFSGGATAWNGAAAAWIAANTRCAATAYSYWTGIFLSGQNSHADALAQEIVKARRAGGKVHIIGHSNGCDLLALALQRNPLVHVDDAFLLAAADYDDCGNGWWKNGLDSLIANTQIRRLILGVSADDDVLGATWLLPWWWGRTLGKDGPVNCIESPWACQFAAITPSPGDHPPPIIIVGRNDTYGHCDWVDPSTADGGAEFNTGTIKTILNFEGAMK